MAVFVGVLMTATLCGTAIGAILADWLGFQAVFLIATFLAACAGLLALLTLFPKSAFDRPSSTNNKKAGSHWALLSNKQFLLLVLLCAIPAKIVLTGILYLLVPLYLAELAVTQTEIGRVMMLYSLIIIPVSPIASRFADKLDRNILFVLLATLGSGAILVVMYPNSNVSGVIIMVAGLGLIHAFLKAPLIVSVIEAAEKDPRVSRTAAMSLLRTSERIGSVLGPILVALLLTQLSYSQTAACVGALVLVAGTVMVMLQFSALFSSKPKLTN